MTDTLDLRGLRAAPPYLEDEESETAWLRADLAPYEDDAREHFIVHCGVDAEHQDDLVVKGPVAMHPDMGDEFHERWVFCEDAQAQARYWQVNLT